MLTSRKNPRIQHIRKLQTSARTRRADQLFIVEGIRLVEEVFHSGLIPEAVFCTEDITSRGQKIITGFKNSGVEVTLISPHVMQAASDTKSPQGILVLMPVLQLPIPKDLDFMVILDGIRDPGNLGTILRTAHAASAGVVLIPPGTADPFAPKVVRAAMGAHFGLPIYQMDWEKIRDISKSYNLNHYLADSSGGQPYECSDFRTPLALIIGGEASGAGREAEGLASTRIHINMPGEVESLNVAAAAAVLMFEIVRQRKVTIFQNDDLD
jgi:TrmH family RNA methyltransferase